MRRELQSSSKSQRENYPVKRKQVHSRQWETKCAWVLLFPLPYSLDIFISAYVLDSHIKVVVSLHVDPPTAMAPSND
ncbi:hypothetical protein RIF29_31976 [Crotalaria pallida]|uniref:Uncharacterized protein n=1 Tax=Crotalaria pallida TaxID=3830 RepID=A0AAN9EK52_CROPI